MGNTSLAFRMLELLRLIPSSVGVGVMGCPVLGSVWHWEGSLMHAAGHLFCLCLSLLAVTLSARKV